MLQVVKGALDIGLHTDQIDDALAFYVGQLGLEADEVLPLGRGFAQHRLTLHQAVLKVNASPTPLSDAPTLYRGLGFASPTVAGTFTDPDGLPVHVGEPGPGVDTAVTVASADLDAHRRWFTEGLGAIPTGESSYRFGTTLLTVQHDPTVQRAGPIQARGLRYLTVQVADVVAEHRRLVDLGFEEAIEPFRAGEIAAISFVRDPGGGWLEISQRASLTGPLPTLGTAA